MPGRSRSRWVWTRPAVGAAILAVLVWQLGTGPFLEPLHRIDARSLAAATGIAVLTTVCCAWRWSLVSRGLGSDLPLREAVGAYYRSQFLNTVLPGGVLGDVHRAVRRGRDVGDVGHGVRVVAWERTSGQAVQIALTVVVLLALPSPVRSSMPVVAGAVLAVALSVVLLGRTLSRWGTPPLGRIARAMATDLRQGLLARRSWPGVVLASIVVVAGHTATFLIAARTAGSTASPAQMLPLALLVLLAMGLPTNIAGWGPREGAAAWVFAVAGLGAAEGVATAVVYGVMALVATLPGAFLLASAWLRPRKSGIESEASGRARPATRRQRLATAAPEGAPRG
ncbi:MAG TPA: lysylphosphatidylglycerol synthase transmembrane domain-containing protein [Nocardioidaceae bacterium]|nr:lysylphosphatidylglycerol synthase transmembrane domain-containing protein [Nocardioidaceae bacterium]